MEYVRTLNDIIGNLTTLENYLTAGSKEEASYAKDLVKNGTNFVVYKVEGVNHFAPSVFIGYQSNTMKNDIAETEKDNSENNKKIAKVVGKDAFSNGIMETNFAKYCASLGITAAKQDRSYWRLYEGGSYLEL